MLTYNEFVLESKLNNLEEVNEGFKEIALSLLLLTGVIGAKGQYAKVVKNPTDGFVQNVEDFVYNKDNVNKLWDIIDNDKNKKFDDKEEYEQKLKSSIDLLKQRSDKIDNKKVKFKRAEVSIKDTSRINELLKKGWLPQQLVVTKDTIIKDSLAVKEFKYKRKYPSDAIFKTGSWELTNDFKEDLKSSIDGILNNYGIGRNDIYEIQVSTSTDKEPISIGNEKLSNNRANSVIEFLNTIISVDISTKDDDGESLIKFDQGPDLYTKSMTTKERKLAREETEIFRDVVIVIKYNKTINDEEPITYKQLIENEELIMIRISEKSKVKRKDKYQTSSPNRQSESRISIDKVTYKCLEF